MSIFDKLSKKNKLDEAMDKAFEDFAENNPITRKAKQTIEDAGIGITKNLEKNCTEKYRNTLKVTRPCWRILILPARIGTI